MKKMIVAIFISLIVVGNSSDCMDSNPSKLPITVVSIKNAGELLANDGKYLKELLNIEAKGKCSPELFDAEETLKLLFRDERVCSPYAVEILKNIDKGTRTLAQSVVCRIADRGDSITAIKDGNASCLEKILNANRCMANAYGPDGENLLHKAIILEKKECFEKLFRYGANFNCVGSYRDYSALHYAADKFRRIDIVEFLLAGRANPESTDCNGKTPFDIACRINSPSVHAFEGYGYLFFSSVPSRNPFMLLKDDGKYLKELVNQPIGSFELESAFNSLDKFFNYIVSPWRCSSSKNTISLKNNNFILRCASRKNCEKLFGEKTLLDAEEELEKKEIKRSLVFLASGFSSNITNLETILINNSFSSSFQYHMLKRFICDDDMQRLELCLKNEFNPNSFHKKMSLLHCAVESNKPDAIKILAKYNPDLVIRYNPTSEPGEGYTPLDYAYHLQRKICADVLVTVIKERCVALSSGGGSCGLTKHILDKASEPDNFLSIKCQKCLKECSDQVWSV